MACEYSGASNARSALLLCLLANETAVVLHAQGYTAEHDSWEPRSGLLEFCSDLVDDFDARHAATSPAQPKSRVQKRKREESFEVIPRAGDGAAAAAAAAAATLLARVAAANDSSHNAPKVPSSPSARTSTAPTMVPSASDERAMQRQGCMCQSSCSMLPFILSGMAQAGDGVLSYCYKDTLCFGDLDTDGNIRTLGCDGSMLQLEAPCIFARMVMRRVLGRDAVLQPKHPHKMLHYKGVRIDRLRAAPLRTAGRRH